MEYGCPLCFGFPSHQATTEHWVEFLVLHRRVSLVTCLTDIVSVVHMPASASTQPPLPALVCTRPLSTPLSLFLLCKQVHPHCFSKFPYKCYYMMFGFLILTASLCTTVSVYPRLGKLLDTVPGFDVNNTESCQAWLRLPDAEHTGHVLCNPLSRRFSSTLLCSSGLPKN